MIWFLYIFLFLGFLLLVISLTRLTVEVCYYHRQDNDQLTVTIRALFGIVKRKIDIPLIKIDDNSPTIIVEENVKKGTNKQKEQKDVKQITVEDFLNSLHDTKELISHIVGLHSIIKKFLQKVKVKRFEWNSKVGTGDAAATGTLTGAIWGAKSMIIGLLTKYLDFKVYPVYSISPDFQKAISSTKFNCIFMFTIGNAILAGIKFIRYWRGGMASFKSKKLSVLSKNNRNTTA
ncbi:DUF2953 domain-containing protein [Peribacillus tepidiphilus]|uniref:DUF2953 domain-containing protein n=1 Tax=Peribacillus tepidiphilus TaxID=2652445 RepID=UPI0035B52C7B